MMEAHTLELDQNWILSCKCGTSGNDHAYKHICGISVAGSLEKSYVLSDTLVQVNVDAILCRTRKSSHAVNTFAQLLSIHS